MAKLSETFKIEGGSNTAPVSNNGQRKLSETFKVGQSLPLPSLQKAPSTAAPVPTYDNNVIKEYESLPKTDIFSRLFSKESRDAYKRKQELNPLYEQNKDLQTKQLLNSVGLSDDDIMRHGGNTAHEQVRLTQTLREKGITDKATIDAIKAYASRRLTEKTDKNLTEYADEHPVKGSALSIPFRMVAGVAGQAENAANYLSGNPLSNSQGALAFNNSVNNMRGAVADDMNGVGRFLYNSGMSMGDMLANRWMLGPLAPVGMGVEKATDTTNSAVNQGLTPNQIMLKNISSGVTTYLTEKYLTMPKLDALKEMGFSALGKEGGKQIVLRALNAAGLAEGLQEGAEDVADWIADALIARDKNEFKQAYDAYKEQGLSDGKAVASVIGDKATELVMDMAGGYLSGFAGGGAEMAKAGVANNINNRNTNIPTLEQTSEATTPVEQPTQTEVSAVKENASAEQPVQTEAQNNVSKNIDPVEKALMEPDVAETHTPDEIIKMKEYVASTKPEIVNYANEILSNPKGEFEPLVMEADSPRAIADIERLTGINPSGNTTILEPIEVIHNDYRHGENGKSDHSMADKNTFGRLEYIRKNYDEMFLGKPTRKRGKDGQHLKAVVYVKKIDGQYYVVEVASDAKAKKNYIIGAFIGSPNSIEENIRKGSISRGQDAPDGAPYYTSKNEVDTTSLSDTKISDTDASVKSNDLPTLEAPVQKVYDTKSVSDKALNKILNDHFNMFAKNDEGNALRAELKQAINEYSETHSADSYNRIVELTSRAEQMLKNGTYTFKRDANKRSGKVRTTSYPNYRGTVTDNVMGYVNKLQGMDNLLNKTNEAYRTEINNLAEILVTANADESAWDYLNEIKENLDQFVETGDEDVLENAVNAVGDMVSAAGINYSNVQKDFEQALNNAVEANKRNSKNKVMAEDIGLNKKSKAKQIPSVDNNDATTEVPIEDLEDRRNGATYVGRTASNTLRNAEMFNPETGEKIYETRKLIEDQIKNGNADVERQTWLAANKEAVQNLDENGFEKEKQRILESGTETTQTQIAESVYIMDNEINKALKSGETTQLGIFVNRLVQRMHKVGQALQALRLYGNTASGMALATDSLAGAEVNAFVNDAAKNPNGKKAKALKQNAKLAEALKQLGYDGTMEKEVAPKAFEQYKQEVQNTLSRESSSVQERFSDTDIEYLARLLEHGATTEDIKNALNRHFVTGYFGISAEDLQAITDLYNQADQSKSSKETAELRKQAAAIASKYLGKPTFMDKWNAWRYLSMLGNPRTMIRNILGNTTFGAVTDIKDAVGAVLESAFIKDGERTKAILTKADSNLIKACADYFDKKAYGQATEGGHKFNMKHEVEGERQIFKSKLLEGARKLTDKVLEESDNFALKRKYSKALAGYLKANGYDASVLKTDNSILERANEYAIAQAKEATFHADNSVADMLNDWSRSARERGGLGGKIGEVLIESTMPFKKTPANILKQGFEYSPLSLLKLASQIRSRAGANAYIDTISKGLTGSGILALGAWLASRGLLVGKRDDDDDPYKKGSDYALTIGGKSYSLDWTAPAAMPLFVGVELYNHFNPNESADEAKGFFESLASIGEPAIEMSMLEGLSNTLDAISNAKNNKASATAANIISGYVSQAIPTLSGQIARTIDPYRRSTRTNASTSSNAITATLEKSVEKVMNKIPGLSMLNQKYVDVWGNPQKNSGGNLLGRAFQNFVSPGYLNDVSLTDREKKLADLQKTYEGSGSLIPTLAKSNKPDGSRMTNAEYERYSKARGQELQKAVDAALKYKGKSGVKTEVLQDCVHDIENFANFVTEHKQFGKKISDTYKKAYEAYELGGYDGVMLYYLMNKNADLDGNGSVTQEELAKYLRSSDIPRKQREDYFKIKFPKAKEIPTLR